jgi:serpin B
MRRLLPVLFAVIVGCAEFQQESPVAEHPGKPTPEVLEFAKNNNQFAFDLFAKLGEKPGNVFFSPYSVSTSMAMVYAGANGTTADEIAKAMHFSPDAVQTASLAALLERHLTSPVLTVPSKGDDPKQAAVTIAPPFLSGNALWADRTCVPVPDFVALMSKEFRGEYRKVDFAGDPSGARDEINRWVEKRTRNRIPELLDQSAITPRVRIVLTNAIAFDGTWRTPFDPQNTKPQPFFRTPKESVDVPTMALRNLRAGYAKEEAFEFVDLPLNEDDFGVCFAVPNEGVPLSSLEAKLTEPAFSKACGRLGDVALDLTLPKFTCTCPRKLNDEMKSLGIVAAFGAADFSKMSKEGLAIDAIHHNATITVDEVGARAAAATAIVMAKNGLHSVTLHVDRPFLLFVVHRPTRAILFQGRIVDPR